MLKWKTSNDPIPDHIVNAAEAILGVSLPESYKKLAQRYPGGSPDKSEFKVKLSDQGRTWSSCIGGLLSLDPRKIDNVFACLVGLSREDGLPQGLIPISDDGGGDLICLDYRFVHEGPPSVVYWAHELGGENGIIAIASSFDEFLEILEQEADQFMRRA